MGGEEAKAGQQTEKNGGNLVVFFQCPEPFGTQDAKSRRPELRWNGPFPEAASKGT